MKPILLHFAGAVTLSFSLAACIPAVDAPASSSAPTAAPAAPPTTQPAVVAIPTPPPTSTATTASSSPPSAIPPPVSADLPDNWMDAPRTPGDWSYEREASETFAIYATGGEEPHAIIRCDLTTRRIGIGRFSSASPSASMRIYTETRNGTLTATARDSRFPLVAAELDPQNRLLDAMAVTKGNFAMQVDGMPTLYLPGWAEVTRIIEDCR